MPNYKSPPLCHGSEALRKSLLVLGCAGGFHQFFTVLLACNPDQLAAIKAILWSVDSPAAAKEEKRIVVRVHPEVALRVIEEEPGLLDRLRKRTRLDLQMRDDPLMRLDEFRLLSGPAETDVTEKYAA